MSASCFSFLTPAPASKRVIKRYNDLIAELFKDVEQQHGLQEEIPGETKKIIKQIQEYVQATYWNTGKVSRRLQRKIDKALKSNKLFSVKIAVHTYLHILVRGTDQDSIKLSKELVSRKDSVISSLLGHSNPALLVYGNELLSCFLYKQPDAESCAAVSSLMPSVLEACSQGGRIVDTSKATAVMGEVQLSALRCVAYYLDYLDRVGRAPEEVGNVIAVLVAVLA